MIDTSTTFNIKLTAGEIRFINWLTVHAYVRNTHIADDSFVNRSDAAAVGFGPTTITSKLSIAAKEHGFDLEEEKY